MDSLAKGAIGFTLMIVGVAAFGFGLYQLVKTGTCGSGGPYVYAVKACPSSTGAYVGSLIGGVFVFLIGGAIFASRGRTATDPGLPPAKDDLVDNPKPFGSSY